MFMKIAFQLIAIPPKIIPTVLGFMSVLIMVHWLKLFEILNQESRTFTRMKIKFESIFDFIWKLHSFIFRCKSESDLRKHLETHSAVPSYKCPVEGCSYTTRSKTCYSTHYRRNHEVFISVIFIPRPILLIHHICILLLSHVIYFRNECICYFFFFRGSTLQNIPVIFAKSYAQGEIIWQSIL